jgi:hypothetical protein
MVSVAVACLPAAVSLLLLEALFMQISGVSLALTWPHRLCLLRVLLCMILCYKLSPFQAHWGRWHCSRSPRPVCLFTSHMGSGSSLLSYTFSSHRHFYKLSCFWLLGDAAAPASRHVCLQLTWEVGLPPSPVEFSSLCHSHKLSRSWLLGACPFTCRNLSGPPGLFIYSSWKDSLPPIFGAQCAPSSFPRVFIVLIAYYSVSLFPWVEVSLSRGLCCPSPGCLW